MLQRALPLLLSFFLLLALLPSPTPALSILNNSTLYTYAGCYNETTELPGTSQLRALSGGIQETLPDAMTVPLCLDFCAHNTSRRYAYAGLEYARECWCADALSSLSVRLDDADCGYPCDGDNETACGGALRLSVYNLTEEARSSGVAVMRRGGGGIVWGVGLWGVSVGIGAVVGLVLRGF
ncbi:hypothetical protein F4810DRAFT_455148 [Camillea tinctor]|nr:hypothetical protein F4810DRAFT_455148 [Camillea tinctor]